MNRASDEPSTPVEVEQLAAEVRRHRQLYYNEEPELSDDTFDALESRLRALAPEHPVLAEVGFAPNSPSPSQEVDEPLEATASSSASLTATARALLEGSNAAYNGTPGDPKQYKQNYLNLLASSPEHPVLQKIIPARGFEWTKVAHEIPMGSLNKVNTEQELKDWIERCNKLAQEAALAPITDNLFITEKLDGISIEILYDHGELEAAITRGDGVIGERITPNVARMQGVPARIRSNARVSVRGEIILRKSNVAQYESARKRADPRFDRVKSLRNTASGGARTKLHELSSSVRYLSVVFFDVEGVEGLTTESDKHQFLLDQGFPVPFHERGTLENIIAVYRRYSDGDRKGLDYEIDGLVVRANTIRTQDLLGELNNRPRAAVAFKFSNETEVSMVRAIEWSTGDTGRITPIAQIDPVMLAGAEIRQASLHNLGRIRELNIAAGDQVLVSRRNDVIPYVEEVVIKGTGREEAPTHCGACQHPVQIDGEYIVCVNPQCPARLKGRVSTWIRQLGLLEWGEKTLERFFDEGLINEAADLYRLKLEDISELHGFGEDSARKLLEPLQAKKHVPFPVFVAALGIPAVSKETGKLLAQSGFTQVEQVLAATPEQLSEIEGLGQIKAEKILDGLKERVDEIRRLSEVGVTVTEPDAGGPLAGLSFCFSGSHNRPRKLLVRLVEEQGGSVASGVKKGLSYLVLADASSTSSKAQKARKLGTRIIDEAGFESVVLERGGGLNL